MSNGSQIRVAVLRGGPSHAYESSLQTGAHVLSLLRKSPEKFAPLDIFVSKDGKWHLSGLEHEPYHALRETDVVWNALHGDYGEDGQVQRILETLGLPFTGGDAISSSLSTNKDMAKRVYERHSLPTPLHELLSKESFGDEHLIQIFRTYLHPVVVKPADKSHSLGVRLAHTFQELKQAVKDAFSYSKKVLVEEHVKGHELTVVTIDKARGEEVYALLPTNFSKIRTEERLRVEEMAKRAHQVLGLRHYSSSDFVVTPKGKIYLLETNALPAFHQDSHLHRSLEATGWRSHDFVEHVISLALNK